MNRTIQVSALLMAAGVHASYSWGACPVVASQATFEVERYTGKWFEVARDRAIPYEIGAKCVNADYEPNSDGSINVTNNARVFNKGWSSLTGKGVVSNEGGANLVVALHTDVVPSPDDYANYRIISTDYDSYSIFYTCTDKTGGLMHEDYFYILTREPVISDEAMADIVAIVNEKIPEYDYEAKKHMTKQGDGCDY